MRGETVRIERHLGQHECQTSDHHRELGHKGQDDHPQNELIVIVEYVYCSATSAALSWQRCKALTAHDQDSFDRERQHFDEYKLVIDPSSTSGGGELGIGVKREESPRAASV